MAYPETWAPALNNTATTTYTFTPTAGLCANTTTMTITVNPNVTILHSPPSPGNLSAEQHFLPCQPLLSMAYPEHGRRHLIILQQRLILSHQLPVFVPTPQR